MGAQLTSASDSQIDALAGFLRAAMPKLADGSSLRLEVGDHSCMLDGRTAVSFLQLLGSRNEGRGDDQLLSTGQVGDLLGVSRPTVVALIDDGALPAIRVGTHRRVKRSDALAHLERSRSSRSNAMDELVTLSEELHLYDEIA